MDICTDSGLSLSLSASQLQDEADNSEVHSDNSTNRVFTITVGSNMGNNTYWKIKMPYLHSKAQCAVENVQGLTLSMKHNQQ